MLTASDHTTPIPLGWLLLLRFTSMFDDLEQVMRCIINCSAVARTAFKNRAALYDLWRYLNLLHVTAYCGVTETYTRENLFSEFCEARALDFAKSKAGICRDGHR